MKRIILAGGAPAKLLVVALTLLILSAATPEAATVDYCLDTHRVYTDYSVKYCMPPEEGISDTWTYYNYGEEMGWANVNGDGDAVSLLSCENSRHVYRFYFHGVFEDL